MRSSFLAGRGWLAMLALLAGCVGQAPDEQTSAPPPAASPGPTYTACAEPRPEMCTFDYRPVCGIRAERVRCVKEPCLAALPRTYGNACTACADPAVSRYKPGECDSADRAAEDGG